MRLLLKFGFFYRNLRKARGPFDPFALSWLSNEMKSFFLISCIMVCGLAKAQYHAKIFVYSQEFSPGIVPDRNENGVANRPKSTTRYYIYFSQSNLSLIQFDCIRLDSQWYKINIVDTIGTPIYLKEPEKKLLVSQTRSLVLQLHSGEICSAPKGESVLKKTGADIIYRQKGRKYTLRLSKIHALPPVLGQ